MFSWFRREKSLRDVLSATKKIKLDGVIFHIKKLDPMDHLQGFNVLQKVYTEYQKKAKGEIDHIANLEKTKKYLGHIISAGCVKPKIVMKEDGSSIHIDEVLQNLELSQKLAVEILTYTFKKKSKPKQA